MRGMTAYLINHLRIPGGLPKEEGLPYLEQVEETVRPYGGKWLAQDDVEVVEGAWPGSVVLMEFPSIADARSWYNVADFARNIRAGREAVTPLSARFETPSAIDRPPV